MKVNELIFKDKDEAHYQKNCIQQDIEFTRLIYQLSSTVKANAKDIGEVVIKKPMTAAEFMGMLDSSNIPANHSKAN